MSKSKTLETLVESLKAAAEKATAVNFVGDTAPTLNYFSPENILALVQALEEARELAEFYAVPGAQNKDWEWGRGLRNTRMKCTGKKARAFLEKYFKNE